MTLKKPISGKIIFKQEILFTKFKWNFNRSIIYKWRERSWNSWKLIIQHPRMSKCFDRRTFPRRKQSIEDGLRCRGKGCAGLLELRSVDKARSELLVSQDRPLSGTWSQSLPPDCISRATYRANYIREFSRHKPNLSCMAVDLECRTRTWCSLLNNLGCLRRVQIDIHSRVLRLQLLEERNVSARLNGWKENQLTIVFTFTTLNGPIVVAVVMNATFAIEQQAVFTSFQCQRSILAEEELIAVLRVSVRLLAIRLGAVGRGAVCWNRKVKIICLRCCCIDTIN